MSAADADDSQVTWAAVSRHVALRRRLNLDRQKADTASKRHDDKGFMVLSRPVVYHLPEVSRGLRKRQPRAVEAD